MKILLCPTNFAGQPMSVRNELRRRGIEADHLCYIWNQVDRYGFTTDQMVHMNRRNWHEVQIKALSNALCYGYDIYHFWQRSFFYSAAHYDLLCGMDLPIIKSFGKKIIYRFTGYDLRIKSQDMALNPYSPFHYGFSLPYSEDDQRRYLDFLQQYVDAFVVQDPEMQSFLPQAKIIPRLIDLDLWPAVGIVPTDRPLVVHAPSNDLLKGTRQLLAAVEALKDEGLRFDFKAISGLPHAEAIEWYRRADIIVDQLLIGWHGILGLEGMALGKPVVAYLRDALLDGRPTIPIENANPDTIKEKLRLLICDYDRRSELGRQARRYVESVHASDKVADQLVQLYREVGDGDSVARLNPAGLKYIEIQLQSAIERVQSAQNFTMIKAVERVQLAQNFTMIKAVVTGYHWLKRIVWFNPAFRRLRWWLKRLLQVVR